MSTENFAIECRAAVEISPTATNEILFLPIGLHAITPVAGGIGRPIKVKIGPDSAQAIEKQRAALMASGKRPYFDFNHDDNRAAFWPMSFTWRNGEGVIASGEWSQSGKTAVEGKDFRAFSPVFHVDNKRAEAALVICKETADPNMGGLVNNPAFKDLPLWAKNAESIGTPENGDNAETRKKQMEIAELDALRSKQQELIKENEALKSAAATTENEKREETVQNELKAISLEIENAELKAQSERLGGEIRAVNQKNAQAAVKAAIQRGAILPKDVNTQNDLIRRATGDPSFLSVIAGMQGNASLGTRITGTGSNIQIVNDEPAAIFGAMAKIMSNQHRATKVGDKVQLSKEFSRIYKREVSPLTAGRRAHRTGAFSVADFDDAIQAADVTDTNLGTLSGTLVTQRTLELLKFSFPALTMFTTDFSDEPAKFNQTIMTRTIDVPNVTSYSTSSGWTDSSASTNDVPITIDAHRGVNITFNENILASTVRRLFDEFAPAQAYALGKDLMDDLYSNITDANFTNNSVITTSAFNRASVVDVGIALDLRGVPAYIGNRTMLLYPTVFGNLEKDSVMTQFAAFQQAQLMTNPTPNGVSLVIPVESFQVVKAPNLPTNDGNVTGFAGSKSALCIATRVPSDYASVLPGASFGNVQMITDPDIGITVMLVQYVNHQLATATQRIALMYGTAAGQGDAGQLIKAATGSGSSRTS